MSVVFYFIFVLFIVCVSTPFSRCVSRFYWIFRFRFVFFILIVIDVLCCSYVLLLINFPFFVCCHLSRIFLFMLRKNCHHACLYFLLFRSTALKTTLLTFLCFLFHFKFIFIDFFTCNCLLIYKHPSFISFIAFFFHFHPFVTVCYSCLSFSIVFFFSHLLPSVPLFCFLFSIYFFF